MIGAIIGDVIGSRFEWNNVKSKDFELFTGDSKFTDDTVLTVAVADAILNNKDYTSVIKQYGRKYPFAGYGGRFRDWLADLESEPYNSWGNGSAMRVSPVGFAGATEAEVMAVAKQSAEVTHNHPDGIKGAQAVAMAIYLARKQHSKSEIKTYVETKFQYDLSRKIDDIRATYTFDVSCQGSVPEAIIAFLESADFEDAIRTAISIGGDSDTIACITGSIAQAYYGEIPEHLLQETLQRLPLPFTQVIGAFKAQYGV